MHAYIHTQANRHTHIHTDTNADTHTQELGFEIWTDVRNYFLVANDA